MTTEYLNNKVFESVIDRFQTSKREKTRHEFIIDDLTETTQRKAIRKVNDDKEVATLKTINERYSHANSQFVESQKELAFAFYKLSENIVRYAKNIISDQDDAIQEGVIICFEKIDRFDPRKGKAFNYMTTCILNHYRQIYRTRRCYDELKHRYLNHLKSQLNGSFFFKNGKELLKGSGEF